MRIVNLVKVSVETNSILYGLGMVNRKELDGLAIALSSASSVSAVLTTAFLTLLKRQCFTWMFFASASSYAFSMNIFANISRIALISLFTEMNTIAPPKSCVNSLPASNEFKVTKFLLCLKKILWKSFGILVAFVNWKNCQQPRASRVCNFKLSKYLSQTRSIPEHPEDRLWTNL